MEHDTTVQLPPVELTEDQRNGLIALLSDTYPLYRVWWAAGIWYAVGPKPCGCPHTLHAPGAGALAEALYSETVSR